MASNKAKRSIHLAQPKPQHAKYARAGRPGSKRRSPNPNPEQILRPKYGLRISPTGSQPPKTRLHARKAAQPAELMPVKAHAYRTLAELNGGFEKVIQELETLGQISYYRSGSVTAIHDLICRIRAQANRELIAVLNDRETANAGHFGQLCIERENTRPAADR